MLCVCREFRGLSEDDVQETEGGDRELHPNLYPPVFSVNLSKTVDRLRYFDKLFEVHGLHAAQFLLEIS